MLTIEPWPPRCACRKGTGEQGRADGEDERDRQLGDDEQPAESSGADRSASALAQCLRQVRSRGTQRRHESEQEGRDHGQPQRDREHTPEAVVTRMKADGAICVKTFYERGFGEVDELRAPRLDTVRALVAAAHAAHLPVLIHANSTDGQEFAVAAGVYASTTPCTGAACAAAGTVARSILGLTANATSWRRTSATCCGFISPSASRRRRMARAWSCDTRDSLTPISTPICFIVTSP